jgi:hypothetical protein
MGNANPSTIFPKHQAQIEEKMLSKSPFRFWSIGDFHVAIAVDKSVDCRAINPHPLLRNEFSSFGRSRT